jgi:hypothetical protein
LNRILHEKPMLIGGDSDADGVCQPQGRRALVAALAAILATGLAGVVAIVGGVAIGSIISGWAIEHIPTAGAHPVVVSLLTTAITTVLLYRSIPLTRLRRYVPVDGAPQVEQIERSRAAWGWILMQVIFAAAVALIVHHQVLGTLSVRTPGFIGDRDWYIFVSWKTAQLLKSGHNPFQMMSISAPYGYDVLLGDGFLPPLVGAPLYLIFPPYAAYNILLMLATASGFLSGARLAGLFTDSRIVRLISAAAICSAPVYYFRYLGHLSMAFVFPVTLVVAEVVLMLRSGRIRPIRMAGLLLICFGCTAYFFLSAVGVLGLGLLVLVWRRSMSVPLIRSLLIVSTILVICVAPFAIARGRFLSSEVEAGSTFQNGLAIESETFNSDVLSLALPTFPAEVNLPGAEKIARHVIAYSGEGNYAFPGLLLLVMGIGGLLLSRAVVARVAAAAGFGLWVMSLGPTADIYGINTSYAAGQTFEWLPYRLARTLPFLSGLRAPGRFSLLLPSLLGVGLALSLQACVRAAGTARKDAWLLHALFVGSASTLIFNVPLFPTAGMTVPDVAGRRALGALSKLPGRSGRVMAVPACGGTPGVEVVTQIWHHLDMVGCQGPYLGLPFASGMQGYRESEDFIALSCQRAQFVYGALEPKMATAAVSADLAGLRQSLGIRFLLVDEEQLQQCPVAGVELAKVDTRFAGWKVDDRFRVIDLDQPR